MSAPDKTLNGAESLPHNVDIATLIAEGFFPTHAPRPAGFVPTQAVREYIDHALALNAAGAPEALSAQPAMETEAARIGTRSHSAAGMAGILQAFDYAIPRLGVRNTFRTFLRANQKDGFDCQSCAWPSPDGKRHRFEFCENGARAMGDEGSRQKIGARFFREWSIDTLAAQPDVWLNRQGRLIEPLVRREGSQHYEPIEWEEAFDLIGRELSALLSPDGAAFYTSGRCSNEAAFLYQLFARQFGTNNLPDCSNMCHESSGTALVESLGIGKGTVTLQDFEDTELILIVGQNPGSNHPRMLTSLEHAKKHGAKIIAINPLPETGLLRFTDPNPEEYPNPLNYAFRVIGPGVPLADLHLPVRINGDIAVCKGLMKVMLERDRINGGVVDHEFIREHTSGFDELLADLNSTSWEEIEAGSGLARSQIEEAGLMVAAAKRMICCWAMGLTQHRNAVATIRMLVNVLLMGGHIGRRGAGTCCVRGHSNVQGDRTMGIWERPVGPFLDALEREFGFRPPHRMGHDTVDTIKAMLDGEVEIFVGMGGNFLAAAPDTVCTAEALRRCRLTVQVATKLNRGHLITGRQALLLPCLGRSEIDSGGFLTVEDAFGIISSTRGHLKPASEQLKSEPQIIAGIAKAALGPKTRINWDELASDYSRIRDHISRVVPGFADFNGRISRGPFYLPNPARERRWVTETKRARFAVAPISEHPLEPGQFLLMTVRSHDQFNTTVYRLNDRYRGIHGGRRVIFVNPEDASARGWKAQTRVDIISHFDSERRIARRFQVVPYPIPRGCVAAYFPEANVLVPVGSVAEKSNTPTSKSVVVSIEESQDWRQ